MHRHSQHGYTVYSEEKLEGMDLVIDIINQLHQFKHLNEAEDDFINPKEALMKDD